MNLSALAVRYPRVLGVLILTAAVWGVVALQLLPRQEEPVLTWRLANAITRLPGASPERMESLTTDVLERYVEEVDEVEHIYSVSRAGVSLLQIELSDDVTVAEPVWQKVRHKLGQAASELPPGVIGPDLDDEIMGTYAQLIALTGDSATNRELRDHAQRLEDELRYLNSTASTTLFGVQQEIVQVSLDPAKLATQELSFSQVAQAVQNRNTRRSSGRVQIDESELLAEASGEFTSDDQLRNMVLVASSTGIAVHLDDVGEVERTARTPSEPLVRVDGLPAVIVGVRARQDLRIDRFGDQVGAIVERFAETLPEGVDCTVVHDLAWYTRERATHLSRTLLISIVCVFLSTAFFMGWRGAAVVTATIPVTALIVLILFLAVGMPLNQMSVMAVIMAFGLLVDDAIVITEQVHRRVSEGVSARQAASDEPSQLSLPLVITTLTTIAAFLPIYLLPGGVGEFVRAIPVGLTICLLTALLVSVTVIPWLCAHLMENTRRQASSTEQRITAIQRLSQFAGTAYERLLRRAVAWPRSTLLLITIILSLLAALGLTLRRDFFSPVQRDQFIVDVFARQGSALAHTSDVVGSVETILAEDDRIVSTASFVGRNAPLVFYNLESQETYANHFAQVVVRTDDWRQTALVANDLQRQLNSRVPGAECIVHILEHGAPYVAPFEIRIGGSALPVLHEVGRRTSEQLKRDPQVRNVRTNYGNPSPKVIVQVNEQAARRFGIDQGMVADQLRYRLDGLVAGYLRDGDERIDILLRFPESSREDMAYISSVYFKRPGGTPIPFSTVASLAPAWEASSIYRRDGRRTLSVLAYPNFGLTSAEVSRDFSPWLASLRETLPPGYSIELGGENEQRHEAESNLLKNAVYAICAILLLLMFEFHSFRLTVMILALVPMSLGGTMCVLFLTGWPLNFMAMMGMIMLIGVVINDALILVDGFEKRRKAGQAVRDLVVSGTLERTRHVVITTITTIAGFLPLAISPSLLWPPLALAIIGGLTVATLVTLVAIPVAYALLFRKTEIDDSCEPLSNAT